MNAINIKAFIDQEDDEELLKLIPFLKQMANLNDVRPVPLWLEKYKKDEFFDFVNEHYYEMKS